MVNNKIFVHICRASGRKMEKFSVSVNIAAESNVTFILTYEELLQRNLGQYEILTRVKPKSLVQKFQVISSSRFCVLLWLKVRHNTSPCALSCMETDCDKHI